MKVVIEISSDEIIDLIVQLKSELKAEILAEIEDGLSVSGDDLDMLLTPKIEEIIKRRTEAGLSQHQLSFKAGIGGSSLSRIESGTSTTIHLLRAKAIAKALSCKVADIFEKQ